MRQRERLAMYRRLLVMRLEAESLGLALDATLDGFTVAELRDLADRHRTTATRERGEQTRFTRVAIGDDVYAVRAEGVGWEPDDEQATGDSDAA